MDSFYDHPTLSLERGGLKIVCLAETGPRIVGLFMDGDKKNLLAETPEIAWDTPYGRYSLYGGHRLWVAPELPGLCGLPDTELDVLQMKNSLTLTAEPNAIGLQKTMQIRIEDQTHRITVSHTIKNQSNKSYQIAPWGITQLPLGGTVIVPKNIPFSEPAKARLPAQNLVFWPYNNWQDSRFEQTEAQYLLSAQVGAVPFKFGVLNRAGWLAYLNDGVLFVKEISFEADAEYPDYSSNAEVYVSNEFVELESLGGLQNLSPQKSVVHEENWQIYRVGQDQIPEEIEKHLNQIREKNK